MFVKVYRYHIQPAKMGEFLKIQERAAEIYRKHVSYRAVFLQSRDDPGLFLEIQWCRDEDTYRKAMDAINAEPGITQLWNEFETLLRPGDRTVSEEYYEQVRSEGDLTQ